MALGDGCCFFVVFFLECSLWFLVVLSSSWCFFYGSFGFLVVLGGSWWLLVVVGDSW